MGDVSIEDFVESLGSWPGKGMAKSNRRKGRYTPCEVEADALMLVLVFQYWFCRGVQRSS